MTKGCTIVKPFNLSQGKKRTFDETACPYVPIAQQVEAFYKQTPNRYHLRSKKDDISKFRICFAYVLSINLSLVEILAFELKYGMCLYVDN